MTYQRVRRASGVCVCEGRRGRPLGARGGASCKRMSGNSIRSLWRSAFWRRHHHRLCNAATTACRGRHRALATLQANIRRDGRTSVPFAMPRKTETATKWARRSDGAERASCRERAFRVCLARLFINTGACSPPPVPCAACKPRLQLSPLGQNSARRHRYGPPYSRAHCIACTLLVVYGAADRISRRGRGVAEGR